MEHDERHDHGTERPHDVKQHGQGPMAFSAQSQEQDPHANESVNSLNEAIRKELGYLDMVVATPFRVVRRIAGVGDSPWSKGVDDLTWALEGMARVPVKVLQSAFGETFSSKDH